jgi:hypothetical protein
MDYHMADGSYGDTVAQASGYVHQMTYEGESGWSREYSRNADGSYAGHDAGPNGFSDCAGDGVGDSSSTSESWNSDGMWQNISVGTADGHGHATFSYSDYTGSGGSYSYTSNW